MKQIGRWLSSRWSVWIMAIFYIVAGINHFRDPGFYLPLIPAYFPLPEMINYGSGLLELLLGILILFKPSRRGASLGIIVLLILFIPSHWHFIQIGACVQDGLCTPVWVAHFRLWFIHPILILWAYFVGKNDDLL